MGNIRVRKTITLPNGIKININKDSISYTGKDIFGNKLTINPKKETNVLKECSLRVCVQKEKLLKMVFFQYKILNYQNSKQSKPIHKEVLK